MNKKYFLRGLGVGILATSLVLCFAYRKQNSWESVVERATELGMVFPEATPDTLMVASGTAVTVSPEPSEEAEKTEATQTVQNTAEVTNTPMTTQTRDMTATVTPKVIKSTRTFEVKEGLVSESVAKEMKKAGVIQDAEAFDEYLESSGMARKIRSGKYKIPVGASYEEIASIISGKTVSDKKTKKSTKSTKRQD